MMRIGVDYRELESALMLSTRYDGPGVVLYDGPSTIDGERIIMVATGFGGTRNTKTGAGLVQTYILRPGLSPIDAVRSGADRSICGSCPHMLQDDGSRSRYVNLGHGPRVVYDAYRRGIYQHGEVQCPAAKEAGYRTTCDVCVACGGNSAKARADISIVAHGAGAGHYARRSITL